jgi:hypothetical protein
MVMRVLRVRNLEEEASFAWHGRTCACQIGFSEVGVSPSSCFASRYAGVKRRIREEKGEVYVACLALG